MLLRSVLFAASAAVVAGNSGAKPQRSRAAVDSGFGGGGFDEDPDMEDSFLMDLVSEFQEDFQECGLDLDALFGGEDDEMDPSVVLDLMRLSPACSEPQKTAMRDAFLAFQQCSGYEILELDEVFLGAMVGAVVRCVNSMSALDMATMNVPQGCVEAVLGDHPMGVALRDVLLHPGSTGSCFTTLADSLPACSLDLWPFPVDGASIKKGACLSEKIEEIWSEQCVSGLDALANCLPAPGVAFGANDCDTYADVCAETESLFVSLLMMLPQSMQGMPLPDSCASTPAKEDAVQQYEAFRSTCAPAGKQLWAKLESDPTGVSELENFGEFIHANDQPPQEPPREPIPEETPEIVELPNTELTLDAGAGDEEKKVVGGGGGSFGYGMLTGAVLTGLAFVGLFLLRKKQGKADSSGSFVELSTQNYTDDSMVPA